MPPPTHAASLLFACKSNLLRTHRYLIDTTSHISRHASGSPKDFPFVLAESITTLWTDSLSSEATLQLGKVQNLRRATQRLHRILIPANAIFSFWKQLGPTTRAKGYVPGRMLQEGCIIPSIGGGLCQMSNSLYDTCLSSGCEIIERHPHSSVIPGSAASLGRDATVAWNYVDFRFRAPIPLLLESFLTHDNLVVRLRATHRDPAMTSQARAGLPYFTTPPKASANSCETCGTHSCFRHKDFFAGPRVETKSAFLLDECWPEFRRYTQAHQQPGDLFAHPINGIARYHCPSTGPSHTAPLQTLWRSFQTRRHATNTPLRVAAQLSGARAIAQHFSKLLTKDVTTVYVEQSFLPFLWQNMDLGGRTVKVFMTRLPLAELHRRLDNAFRQHPDRTTLNELRAAPETVEAEWEALQYAASIITPHRAIARLFPNKTEKLPWEMPTVTPTSHATDSKTIAFPGPTVARKGAYELRAAARSLNLEVLLLGNELEGPDFWQGVSTTRTAKASVTVQPALIEDKPRMLLKSIAAGLSVIASDACGLDPAPGVHIIPACNESALTEALATVFQRKMTVA